MNDHISQKHRKICTFTDACLRTRRVRNFFKGHCKFDRINVLTWHLGNYDKFKITYFHAWENNFKIVLLFQSTNQWLRQISMKLPYAVLRKSALKLTKGRKRENSISYYFLLFWFNQNSISVLKTLLSCLSEKTLWKVDSDSLYRKQGCMKSW